MKTKKFLSIAALAALSIFAISCSSDDPTTESAKDEKKLTTFSGTAGTAATGGECPEEGRGVIADTLTRSSIQRSALGTAANFSWEAGDYIYIKDDNDTWHKSEHSVDSKKSSFNFEVAGTYTDTDEYTVHYVGNSNDAKKVTISTNQTQSAFNNTAHFGKSGDCAVGKSKAGAFNLEHKATYLCFLPYVTDAAKATTYKIKKVKVTSDVDLAGTYDFTNGTLTTPTSNASKTITLNVGTDGNGLPFANTSVTDKDIANSLYMVVAPGTYALTVEYVIVDTNTNQENTITKKYNSAKKASFDAGKIFEFKVELTPTAEQGFAYTSDLKKDWYTAKAESPSVTLMYWYFRDTWYWDANQEWTLDGQKYKGGAWVKRIEKIAETNNKTKDQLEERYSNGMNYNSHWENASDSWSWSRKDGNPNSADYFFLPALGDGNGKDIGTAGYYWTSKDKTDYNVNALYVKFNSWGVEVTHSPKEGTKYITGKLFE